MIAATLTLVVWSAVPTLAQAQVPSSQLLIGSYYVTIADEVPLMPGRPGDFADPMAALARVVYMPVSTLFVVHSIDREDAGLPEYPWYEVSLPEYSGKTGWINSTALRGGVHLAPSNRALRSLDAPAPEIDYEAELVEFGLMPCYLFSVRTSGLAQTVGGEELALALILPLVAEQEAASKAAFIPLVRGEPIGIRMAIYEVAKAACINGGGG